MSKYLKFDQNGENAYTPPAVMRFPGGPEIRGWNTDANRTRLLRDGWLPYDGSRPLSRLKLVDWAIVELPDPPPPEPEPRRIFSKLKIRRIMRAAGREAELDALLGSVPELKADYADAQDVSLDDPGIAAAIASGVLPEELVGFIREHYDDETYV